MITVTVNTSPLAFLVDVWALVMVVCLGAMWTPGGVLACMGCMAEGLAVVAPFLVFSACEGFSVTGGRYKVKTPVAEVVSMVQIIPLYLES